MITKSGIIMGNKFTENETNYSIIGSPQISDGLLSGCSNSDYIKLPAITTTDTDSWEISCKFKSEPEFTKNFGCSVIPLTNVKTDNNGTKQFGIYRQTYTGPSHMLIFVFDGTNWTGGLSFTVLPDTNYFLTMYGDSEKRFASLKNLDTDKESKGTVLLSSLTKGVSTYFNNTSFLIGRPVVNDSTSLEYTIDLNSFSFKINDKIVYAPSVNTSISEYQVTASEFYEI